ncbi:MAG TPA: hypothetical protein VHO69_02240, partial [Phototrophicaceae bacterium]|nr:hypothetical protein [Phototrophicaceae bacterium]
TAAPVEPTNAPPAPVTQVAANNVNPAATTGSVCVVLFEDANQNRIQETGENALPGGTIVVSQAGQPVGTYQTESVLDPHCFADLSIGDYVAVASAPGGYGLTTSNQLRVQLSPGATINLTFGAAPGVQAVVPPPADAGGALVSETQEQQPETVSLTDRLLSVSGYIIFGLAALVLLGGVGAVLVLRRR